MQPCYPSQQQQRREISIVSAVLVLRGDRSPTMVATAALTASSSDVNLAQSPCNQQMTVRSFWELCNIFLLIDFVWIAARGAVIALSDVICSYFLLSRGSALLAPETNQSIIRYKLPLYLCAPSEVPISKTVYPVHGSDCVGVKI